ncbi:hypothetical protein ACWT_4523 [Actinoplanes sp. SE50]|uniref:hypothetical protein n=1 Tax=unclassified Actinoplanes TaxID=2626549 RepID=UPI00023ED0BC|nr:MULTISPECIES: hypothetical protein [unclassified Actinoplanes]AEV85545.1 hypothetical protein ACPL_4654 [Actinoplanes sp. SE50/110]ATO83938.1 hypothetical protein ACWT_4523 [Actinoplanes sp. SE50]SLM01348.1 hypothetical protein ACSP50_4584 [Actinoplanes sp. SE50/110]
MSQVAPRRVPARADAWRPQDEVLNGLIHKCIEQAYRRNAETGSMAAFFGGVIVLIILGVIMSTGTGNPLLAIVVVVLLAGSGLMYAGMNAPAPKVDPIRILDVLGGPGNLPAGYLVYPAAWRAGMPEFLNKVSDRQVAVAARLCREHPGSVADLIRLVATAEQHAHEHAYGRSVTEGDIYRYAHRATVEWARLAPAPMMAAH